MELIRELHNLRPGHRGGAVSIGNFDGVHLGHRAVIGQLAQRARSLGVPSLIMLFEPQPAEYFRPEAPPARLMRLREKLLALRQEPLDRVLCERFDERFAALEPEAFIERILVRKLEVRWLLVGEDFRFGRNRRGDIEMLRRAGRRYGFEVETAPTFYVDGERVSSTRVRAALAASDLEEAKRLLGRPYRMCGRVVRGAGIGREIGVPTANIDVHRRRTPLQGIFVVELNGLPGGPRPAVASLGTRPTVGGTHILLEVHLLDFDSDIYGAQAAVDFLHKLREERRFDSLEEMRAQILRDIEQARRYFSHRRMPTPDVANRVLPS